MESASGFVGCFGIQASENSQQIDDFTATSAEPKITSDTINLHTDFFKFWNNFLVLLDGYP